MEKGKAIQPSGKPKFRIALEYRKKKGINVFLEGYFVRKKSKST
jgi:hypothetical protein